MVDHLQNLEMGMKNLSLDDQGTISHMLELTIEKVVQVGHFYYPHHNILIFFALTPCLPKKLKKLQSKLDFKKIGHKLGTLMLNMF